MFKTTHLAALTIPLAAVLAWPGQVPLMLSLPVILTAIATFGLGAVATLRECWTSLVGDANQKMLLRLRWAVWLRQPADCSVLADTIVERAGLTFDPNDASERANLVGLMFNLRRMNARHAGAIGTPLTSHELARQLWAVAPQWAQDRDGWLMLAAAAHTQASNVDMPQGPVSQIIRIRNEWIGTVLWRHRRERLDAIFGRAGGWNKPAIPMEELSPFLLASENDVIGTLLHSAISAALLENDLDPRNDGVSALPLAIQARLVALLMLLEAKPGKGQRRAWLIASGKLSQLMALRALADQAQDLNLDDLSETAFEGPAAAEGLFETFANRAKQAGGKLGVARQIEVPDAYGATDAPSAKEKRTFGWGAKITSLADVRAARVPAFEQQAEDEAEAEAEENVARRAAPMVTVARPQSSLAVAEAFDLDDLEASLDDMLNIPAPKAAAPAPVLKPVPGGLPHGGLPHGGVGPRTDVRADDPMRKPGGGAPKPQAPMPKRPVRPVPAADTGALKDAAQAAAEALRKTAPGVDGRFAPERAEPVAEDTSFVTETPVTMHTTSADQSQPALLLRRVWQPGQTVSTRTSQFGGIPNLPAQKAWPRHAERGEPLHFLARLECAALHAAEALPEVLEDMPKKGEILVFADIGSDSAKQADDTRIDVALMFLSARDLGGAMPADLPADLPDIDHDGGASITLSDRPGQRVFPKLGLDICPIQTEASEGEGHIRTQDEIARHLPSTDRAPQRRLFRRVSEADRAASGGYWTFEESALGTGFPANAVIARSVFAAISANASRARSRLLAQSQLAQDAGLEALPEDAQRMAWLEALAASADILRARLPQQGSAEDKQLCATERARIRAWLGAIAHRNPETGQVAETALRDTLRRLAIEAIQSPEASHGLDGTCLRFIAPSLMPTVDEADHRVGGAPLPGGPAPEGCQKFLQLDSDPALGFRFADGAGEGGRLEIWIPTTGKFGARLRRAEGRIVPA